MERSVLEFLEKLDHPSPEYTPVPFWFLNGDLRHGEIRRQLRDFADHGVRGVVLHPRIGLSRRIGYLSGTFFRYLRTALETAAELQMKVVLYDEGMYPSGSASGQVVRENPEWASRGIGLTDRPGEEDRILCRTDRGTLVERFSRGTIRGIHYGEDDGEAEAPRSADILNPDAVDCFLRLTHEAYWREFREYFGNTVIGFFTDEPSILGRNVTDLQPWTAGFDREFLSAGGRLEGLAGLFSGEENRDTALYRRLILQREEEVYYARLSRWCGEKGIALMGHPHQSDDIEVEKYFHVPGQDLVFRWVAPEKGGNAGMDSVMGQCGADMARWMGRRRNSNECFGACNREDNPWYFTGADMKWYIDWLAARGVNLFIPHAFYYSLKGKRSAERPPDVGPGNIWWPHYRRWADYMARMSCLRTETDTRPPIALLCRNRDLHPETAARLTESRHGFMYLPESLWQECREENGKLVCRGRTFEAVAGPEELFSSVSHDPFALEPDCECCPAPKELHMVRLIWEGHGMWLFTNEGGGALETEITLPGPAGRYDLWDGKAFRLESREKDGKRGACLRLERNESALVFLCSPEEWDRLPLPADCPRILTEADFTRAEEDRAETRIRYTAKIPEGSGDVMVKVNAPEMAEVSVNGKPAGAAFWPPQMIRIPAELAGPGGGAVCLTLTGSRANRYGTRPVPWDLEPEN